MSSASIPAPDADDLAATVLIVEDEALMRVVIAEMLQERGFTVLEAANANEAIEIIKKTQIEIDLVFTDVRMPGAMDGFGLVKWIQNSRPTVPVLVASGDIGKANDANRHDMGDMFIAKPYDLDQTTAKIRLAVAARKRALVPSPAEG
jgi:DNA-binding NtrC family response regulator